ncbi:MAG: polysaccharide biosynthesis tyrosine autokinase, partial [Actinomycetota bacterium]|nr:polysaccharide biosynthesis tyrosine autokinase [Actinomycetota bacterium]
MELREYVRACRRRWAWLVVPVLLAAGVAAGLSLTREPAYRSSMVLFVSTGSSDQDTKATRLNSYIALLTGPRVAQTVVAKLKPPATVEEVRKNLSAEVQAGTDLLVVTARDSSAERSRSMVTNATAALVALAKRLDPPGAAGGDGPPPQITVAQEAVTVAEPGNLVRDVGFSAVLGLLVGGVGVAAREATRKTVTEEEDLRRLGIGTVGVISLGGRWGRSEQADSALAEAFRRLRSLLPSDLTAGRVGMGGAGMSGAGGADMSGTGAAGAGMSGAAMSGTGAAGGRGASLMITAAGSKEGTTAVSCGLALAMAETGARVLLVDANLRSPGVGRYMSMTGGPGLADVLAGRIHMNDVLRDPLGGRLTVLPPGEKRADPGEVLASPRLASTLRDLTARFDIVIVDAPPVHGVADAAVLGKVTDGALLVVRAGRTRAVDVRRSADLLERVGSQLVGAVLNALPRRLPDTPAPGPSRPAFSMDSPGLINTLLGEPEEPLPPPNPVSGRARVSDAVATVDVRHTVITPRQPHWDPHPAATRERREENQGRTDQGPQRADQGPVRADQGLGLSAPGP